MQGRSAAFGSAQFQTADNLFGYETVALLSHDIWWLSFLKTRAYLIFGDTIPIKNEKFQTHIVQRGSRGRQIENERFIKNRIQGPFLDVSLLFSHSLSIVNQVDLDVRICLISSDNLIN